MARDWDRKHSAEKEKTMRGKIALSAAAAVALVGGMAAITVELGLLPRTRTVG